MRFEFDRVLSVCIRYVDSSVAIAEFSRYSKSKIKMIMFHPAGIKFN